MTFARTALFAALTVLSATAIARAEPTAAQQPLSQYLSRYAQILKVADAPKVCAPGITRCGATGYVERCAYDGTRWDSTVVNCK